MSKVSIQKLTKDTKANAGSMLSKVKTSKDRVQKQITQLQEVEKQISARLKEEKAAKIAETAAVNAAEKTVKAKSATSKSNAATPKKAIGKSKGTADTKTKSTAKQEKTAAKSEKPAEPLKKTAAKSAKTNASAASKPAAKKDTKKSEDKQKTSKTNESKSKTAKTVEKLPTKAPRVGIRVVKRAPTKEEKRLEAEKLKAQREHHQQKNQERKAKVMGQRPQKSDGRRDNRQQGDRPQRKNYNNSQNNAARGNYNRSNQSGQSRTGGQRSGGQSRPSGQNRPTQGRSPKSSGDSIAIKPTKVNSNYNNKRRDKSKDEKRADQTRQRKTNENPKQSKYSKTFAYGDMYVPTGSRRKKHRKVQSQQIERIVIENAVITTENVAIKELAEKIGKQSSEIVGQLFKLGIIATVNHSIDFDTAEVVAAEFGITLEQQIAKTQEEQMIEIHEESHIDDELLELRAPIVTVMGHVDHGKTSLLDAIREADVQAGEAGGITQHIGAYTVTKNDKRITFIDTPGHQAFTAMRARGAKVTDIAIIVVAADDGVMPQTIEAINHSKAAEVPIIVAINKMDLPAANPARVKQELTEHGIVSEEWGGEHIMVEVSAHTGNGLDNLLEMILLQSEMLELRANPEGQAVGTIIESKLDIGRGPVATVLIKNGTLRIGDSVVAGLATGRVRAMINDKGDRVEEAGPATPVEVIGFSEVPDAGDVLYSADDKLSRKVAEERKTKKREEMIQSSQTVSLDDLFGKIEEGKLKDLNIVLKADVQGSAEAIKQSLEKLTNDEVRVRCIHVGVGGINETDVMLAKASNAIILGFNVRPDSNGRASADSQGVDIHTYRIIYEAIQDVENAMKGLLAPQFKEEVLGHAQVRNVFKVSGVGNIAGCYVTDGIIKRSALVRVLRDSVVIFEGEVSSLKRFKDDVKEVAHNYECGIGVENFNDIKDGDVIEAYEKVEIKR